MKQRLRVEFFRQLASAIPEKCRKRFSGLMLRCYPVFPGGFLPQFTEAFSGVVPNCVGEITDALYTQEARNKDYGPL